VRCDVFLTESTFALPVYRWQEPAELFADVDRWWAANRAEGRTSILYAYAVGKSQRVLASVDAGAGPILVHGAIARFLPAYAASGVTLPATLPASPENAKLHRGRALVIAPPSARGSPWLKKFGPASQAMASGWMPLARHASAFRGSTRASRCRTTPTGRDFCRRSTPAARSACSRRTARANRSCAG
jgi:putative mRNA 3-end processing factor